MTIKRYFMEPIRWPLWPPIALAALMVFVLPAFMSCCPHDDVWALLTMAGLVCILLRSIWAHFRGAPRADFLVYMLCLLFMPLLSGMLVGVILDLLQRYAV